jgi:putative ATPase
VSNQLGLGFSDESESSRPLAALLRPDSFEAFVGQENLRPMLKHLLTTPRHVIFWGPPGSGKTTLAHLLSSQLKLEIFNFSAVTSGVPELKKVIAEILDLKKMYGKQSILFIDEIHRFNKSQQDALLPYLENGDFLFFGATTEYPQTSLNRALISRVSLIELKAHSKEDLEKILTTAQSHLKRDDLKDFLPEIAEFSNGDARFAINQLSILSEMPTERLSDKSKVLKELFEHARQYDKEANRHYDVISAFIKSIRGSDPDAALLYLAIMLDGGENPEFIARRLMILASEDVGLANSQALQVTTNAHYVVKNIGMPEARITLSHATVFMCLSPKSNSVYLGIDEALSYVRENPTIEVPGYLSNVSPEKKNYKYPHSYPQDFTPQDYRPKGHKIKFYNPKANGSEKMIIDQWTNFTKSAFN